MCLLYQIQRDSFLLGIFCRIAARRRGDNNIDVIPEGTHANIGNAIRYRYARQRFTAIERANTNARHAVRDDYARQSCARERVLVITRSLAQL